MLKVTSKEFQRNTGLYQGIALNEPVTITRDGQDQLVLLNTEQYKQLRKRARVARSIDALSETEIRHIKSATMSVKHNHLNAEMDIPK